MTLEERAVLEAGLEWEVERQEEAEREAGADQSTSSPQSNVLDLDQLAALGAEVG